MTQILNRQDIRMLGLKVKTFMYLVHAEHMCVGLSHKNQSGWTDFGRKTCQNWSPWITFVARIGPAGPNLAAKTGSLLPLLVSPVECKFEII